MAEVVFFDLDGTLYENRELKWRMPLSAFGGPGALRNLRLMAAERGCRRTIARGPQGLAGYDTLFSLMSAKTGVPAEQVREWFNGWYMPLMVRQIARHCKPREGVVERIEALRREGVRVAILSDYGFIREKLDALGIDPGLFEALLDAPSLGGFKPSPDVFRAACQCLDCAPQDAIMVGDRPDTDGGSEAVGVRFRNIKDIMSKEKPSISGTDLPV